MYKFLLLAALFFAAAQTTNAQNATIIPLPPSPEASFEQEIGNATLKVTYARPLARGRKIFGNLIPMDSLWRTGASNATTINCTETIQLAHLILPKGKYSLYSIPSKNYWTIIINSDTTLHGIVGYSTKKDIGRCTIPVQKSATFYEAFTITLNDINARGEGKLQLIWENTMLSIPIRSIADSLSMSYIKASILSKTNNEADKLFEAASYYLTTNRDSAQAINWLQQAQLQDVKEYYYPYLLQKVYAEQQNFKAAIIYAKKALQIAEDKKMLSAVTTLTNSIKQWEQNLSKK